MIQGLVLTHGGIGEELVRVVEMILGPIPGLKAETNRGRSAKQVADVVAGWLAGLAPADRALVFIDDYGGSCANAALLGGGDGDRVSVVSGVNLAMLLAFATWRDEIPPAELVQRVVDKGRQAVTVVGGAR
ncbi:MAG: hypothetical protein R3D98_09010 [Candidatus Krumholzibacteriia bacterium]